MENGGYVQIYINDSKCKFTDDKEQEMKSYGDLILKTIQGLQRANNIFIHLQVDLEYQVGKGTFLRAF